MSCRHRSRQRIEPGGPERPVAVPYGRCMIVGFDYWHVLSDYPRQMSHLIDLHAMAGDDVHVISAIGVGRIGTVEGDVRRITSIPRVHEVVFDHVSESPALKLAKCLELRIELFYDDREDVCALLAANGVLALRVPRPGGRSDAEEERL